MSLSISLSVSLSLWLSLCLSLLCPALFFSALSVYHSFCIIIYLSISLCFSWCFVFSFSFFHILGECGRKESTTEIRERYRRQCHYGMCGIFFLSIWLYKFVPFHLFHHLLLEVANLFTRHVSQIILLSVSSRSSSYMFPSEAHDDTSTDWSEEYHP